MKFVFPALVLAYVTSGLVKGASVGRPEKREGPKPPQSQLAVINLLQGEEVTLRSSVDTVDESTDDYYDYGDYGQLSGDFEDEYPRVAFSAKTKDTSAVLEREGKRKGKKGKGRKRKNPCLGAYKDYCIHGECQYLKKLHIASCICKEGFSGERCHFFTLPVGTEKAGYNRTTVLAVMAVVLSSLCLVVIGILLALRYHRRGAYDVENEEKVKLGAASHN